MESAGETHYVSFLSGEGGGMGNSRGGSIGRSGRFFGSRSARRLKRYTFDFRLKAALLAAAAFVSLLLVFGFFLFVAREGPPDGPFLTHEEAPSVCEEGRDAGGIIPPAVLEEMPMDIYEWEDRHFAVSFSRFMTDHAKSYASLEEKQKRFKIYKANLTHIMLHNQQGHSYSLAMNKFGDWTAQEFGRMVKGFKQNPSSMQHSRLGVDHSLSVISPASLPASVDWRSKGCVTPPKDQGQCGSCWAFSASGAVEGAWCSKTRELVSLSEQMLMDCSGYLGNNSCNGGLMDDAFSYITHRGLCTEADYPYEAHDDKCRATRCKVRVHIGGFYDVPPKNETAMKAALATHGPVSVAIQADQVDFQFYKKGVFDAPCGTNLDHGVLLVGYGTDEETHRDFFIMKNSWGTGWGEKGFMRMAQHKGKEGQCGLLLAGSYPLVEGEKPPSASTARPGGNGQSSTSAEPVESGASAS
ncbi:cathepsin L [Cyclospora cayetanensis]|uniref:Cathepsin CPL n=2 Tax=Cyclospora cayetanensis TaxID=88456 RepID=A0A1D3CRC6_9EIME|nr:cathepsin L [Cyclospora cayetanensis]OEH73755.1 cathepsin CPL [Cyclospora cayetanensis]